MKLFKFEASQNIETPQDTLRFQGILRSRDSLRSVFWNQFGVDMARPIPPVEVPKPVEAEVPPQPQVSDNVVDMASKVLPGALANTSELSEIAKQIAKPAYDISEAA